jgi:hypothetical protein
LLGSHIFSKGTGELVLGGYKIIGKCIRSAGFSHEAANMFGADFQCLAFADDHFPEFDMVSKHLQTWAPGDTSHPKLPQF